MYLISPKQYDHPISLSSDLCKSGYVTQFWRIGLSRNHWEVSKKDFLFDIKGHQKVMSYIVFPVLILLNRVGFGCGAILLHLFYHHKDTLACMEN